MENTTNERSSGLRRSALRKWGLLFLTLGIIGHSVIQKELLGIGQLSGQQLLELMERSDDIMLYATWALVLQALECCAAPIFAFLLVDGFQRAGSFRAYVLRVAGLAILSEIPYNLAMSGKVLDVSGRNPVWGLVLGLILLYLFRHYSESSTQNRLIKVMVIAAALLWSSMLSIAYGACMVILVCVVWAFRRNSLYQNIAGATAAVVCTLITPFFLAAPMGFLVTHFYNGEKGKDHRLFNYLSYPVLLLAVGLLAMFGL